MPLQIGTCLGAYEILSPLGAGGMGEVYRARDGKLNRDVALKVLPDSFATDPERLARFQREAQVLASLNHPNIAHIHGIEDAPSAGSGHAALRALVMELVEGPTLADRIAQGAIPLAEALPIAKQIADALEAAHAQGIIHRDLKPANIKVRDDGAVKVLDFGLAKVDGNASASNLSMSPTITSPAMITGGGVILGTAAYMSPEQAKGKAVDKRTDIWAFGCVFFEMLTGARAFAGEDVSETMASILRAEPDWKLLRADVSEQMRVLIRRCLEKDRAKRLADFSVVQFLMNEVLPAAPVPSAIASSSRSLWMRALPIVVTTVIVAALTAVAMGKLRPAIASAVTRFTIAIPDGQFWTGTNNRMIAVSPDGTHIVYSADRRLYRRTLSDLDVTPITGPSAIKMSPVFSPDAKSIAYWEQGDRTIKRMALSGGAAVTVCPADQPSEMSWNGGTIFFGQGSKGIMRVSASGGQPEPLISVKAGEVAHGPQPLPGGQALLFTLATGSNVDRWDKARIVVESLESHERTTLIDGGSDARYLPTGHLVYVLGGVVFAVPFDAKRLTLGGSPMPIVEGVRRAPSTLWGAAQFGISDTGSLAYVPGPVSPSTGQLSVGLFDRKGGTQLLNIQPGPYGLPRMSPDGKRISFVSDDSKATSIWIYELSATSSLRRLTFEGQGRNRFPVWSADSQRIAFQSDREGDLGIFWQRADGTGTAERLTKADEGTSHIPASWSPDGERLLYNTGKSGTNSLWLFSLRDRKAAQFDAVESPAGTVTGAVFSPDGRWVAYASSEGRTSSAVYVQPFPPTGAKYQISKNADEGHHPLWSPDGTELWFSPGPGQLHAVRVTTQPSFAFAEISPVMQLFQNVSPAFERPFDITRDGKHFLGLIDVEQTRSGTIAPQIQLVLNWFEELKQRVPTSD